MSSYRQIQQQALAVPAAIRLRIDSDKAVTRVLDREPAVHENPRISAAVCVLL
jgi:hypothetical protein